MRRFIRKKIEILREEARSLEEPVYLTLFRKAFKKIVEGVILLIDMVVLIGTVPFLLLLFVLFPRRRPKKHVAFFIGLEHVVKKSYERALVMHRRGFRVYFFSFENTGRRYTQPDFSPEILRYRRFACTDVIRFAYMTLKHNPAYLEIYFEGNGLRQLFACLFCRLNKTVTVSVERGALTNMLKHTLTLLYRFTLFTTLKMSDRVFYREAYMYDILRRAKLKESKLFFDFNKVSVKPEPCYGPKEPVVLFLNSFLKWRRLDVVVKAAPIIRRAVPACHFLFVGARDERERRDLEQLIRLEQAESYTEVHDWTIHTQPFYERASVFVLPADLVFCNFSLLEAMERGIPAVVADVPDADRIVEHGVEGFLCKQEPEDLARYIIQLLLDEALRQHMGRAAGEKVRKHFNDEGRMDVVFELITPILGEES